MIDERKITAVLDDFKKLQSRRLRQTSFLVLLPILGGIVLIVFTYTQVEKAQSKLNSLQQEIERLNEVGDSVRKENGLVQQRYERLNQLFSVYNWSPEKLQGRNPAVLQDAMAGNEEILRILDSGTDLQYETVAIRYYVKRADDGRVKDALRSIGYRDILFDNESWTGWKSNQISYSTDFPFENVKFVAYALMREGVEIKAIRPYSPELLRRGSKRHTIEILGNPELDSKPRLTFSEIREMSGSNIHSVVQ